VIAILDYGVGNLASIANMLRAAGAEAQITSRPEDVRSAERVILPGVGHFDHGMRMLNASGLRDEIERAAHVDRKPLLGICLGAQMLGRASAEGTEGGLGWLAMSCERLPEDRGVRVPHMGWNVVRVTHPHAIVAGIAADARFYFVHSYFLRCDEESDVIGTTEHGIEFACAVGRANIAGVQFHPEKSLRHGMALLQRFAAWNPS